MDPIRGRRREVRILRLYSLLEEFANDSSCRFSIQGPVGRTNVFYAFIRAAAEELKCLLKED